MKVVFKILEVIQSNSMLGKVKFQGSNWDVSDQEFLTEEDAILALAKLEADFHVSDDSTVTFTIQKQIMLSK